MSKFKCFSNSILACTLAIAGSSLASAATQPAAKPPQSSVAVKPAPAPVTVKAAALTAAKPSTTVAVTQKPVAPAPTKTIPVAGAKSAIAPTPTKTVTPTLAKSVSAPAIKPIATAAIAKPLVIAATTHQAQSNAPPKPIGVAASVNLTPARQPIPVVINPTPLPAPTKPLVVSSSSKLMTPVLPQSQPVTTTLVNPSRATVAPMVVTTKPTAVAKTKVASVGQPKIVASSTPSSKPITAAQKSVPAVAFSPKPNPVAATSPSGAPQKSSVIAATIGPKTEPSYPVKFDYRGGFIEVPVSKENQVTGPGSLSTNRGTETTTQKIRVGEDKAVTLIGKALDIASVVSIGIDLLDTPVSPGPDVGLLAGPAQLAKKKLQSEALKVSEKTAAKEVVTKQVSTQTADATSASTNITTATEPKGQLPQSKFYDLGPNVTPRYVKETVRTDGSTSIVYGNTPKGSSAVGDPHGHSVVLGDTLQYSRTVSGKVLHDNNVR